MRLAYVCTDRDVVVPGPGRPAREVVANLRALEDAGCDVSFFGTGEGARVPGAWRVVRQRAGNGPKELRDHYAATPLAPTTAEVWSLSVNHRLGRTLEEERQRSPLDALVERASPWSFAAAAFCHQRRIPYVIEVPARPLWERWRSWDAQLESAAQAVHGFSVSLASLVIVRSPGLAEHYRQLTTAPVVALEGQARRIGPGGRPPWARGFVLLEAGSDSPFADLKTIAAAATGLPLDITVRRPEGPEDLTWAGGVVVPATVGRAIDLSPYLAARLPLVLPRGSGATAVAGNVPTALYGPGDPASLRAAMLSIREQVRGLKRVRPKRAPAQLADLVTGLVGSARVDLPPAARP